MNQCVRTCSRNRKKNGEKENDNCARELEGDQNMSEKERFLKKAEMKRCCEEWGEAWTGHAESVGQ